MKRIFALTLCLAAVFCLWGCTDNDKAGSGGDPVKVEMSVKDYGKIELELYPDIAPITVDNFVSLVKDGFYDGLTFHRIVKDFMIQGGDPKGDGTGDSGKNIKGEFTANGVNNTLSHTRGVISMARGNHPDSASSQFFIVHQDSTFLDGSYAAFGKVTSGMETVDKIAEAEVYNPNPNPDPQVRQEVSTPVTPVVIEYIKVIED